MLARRRRTGYAQQPLRHQAATFGGSAESGTVNTERSRKVAGSKRGPCARGTCRCSCSRTSCAGCGCRKQKKSRLERRESQQRCKRQLAKVDSDGSRLEAATRHHRQPRRQCGKQEGQENRNRPHKADGPVGADAGLVPARDLLHEVLHRVRTAVPVVLQQEACQIRAEGQA